MQASAAYNVFHRKQKPALQCAIVQGRPVPTLPPERARHPHGAGQKSLRCYTKEKGYRRAQQPSGESQIPRELVELGHQSEGIGILPVPSTPSIS
jgi:hypothetical protein